MPYTISSTPLSHFKRPGIRLDHEVHEYTTVGEIRALVSRRSRVHLHLSESDVLWELLEWRRRQRAPLGVPLGELGRLKRHLYGDIQSRLVRPHGCQTAGAGSQLPLRPAGTRVQGPAAWLDSTEYAQRDAMIQNTQT